MNEEKYICSASNECSGCAHAHPHEYLYTLCQKFCRQGSSCITIKEYEASPAARKKKLKNIISDQSDSVES